MIESETSTSLIEPEPSNKFERVAEQVVRRRGLLAGLAALGAFVGTKATALADALVGDSTVSGRMFIQPPSANNNELQIGTGSLGGGQNTYFQVGRTATTNGDVIMSAFRAGGGGTQLIVSGCTLRAQGPFLANDANPVGAAPMVLKQVPGNNGIIITDNAGSNAKQLTFGLDPTFTFVILEAVQQGIGFMPTSLNPDGGNVGVGTTSPSAKFHVAGNAQIDGNLTVLGTKSRGVQTASHGMVKMYALETPGNWFEDLGRAQLVGGQAQITFDPVFLETVNTQTQYYVYLTAMADCKGLFVSQQTLGGFSVQELQGGVSNVPFSWRVLAKQRGFEGRRLEPANPAAPPGRGKP